jgi:hypothetical protein
VRYALFQNGNVNLYCDNAITLAQECEFKHDSEDGKSKDRIGFLEQLLCFGEERTVL